MPVVLGRIKVYRGVFIVGGVGMVGGGDEGAFEP